MLINNFSLLEANSRFFFFGLVYISMTNQSIEWHVLSRAKSIQSFLSFYEFLSYFYYFKRKINDRKVSDASLSNAKKIIMNWWYIYRKRKNQEYVKLNWGVKMEQTND